jgi:hypothetical protein
MAAGPGTSQDRLPISVRGNSVVTGQVFGCAVRLEQYYRLTVERAQADGRPLSPAFQLDLVAGLDVAALKADALEAVSSQAANVFPAEEFETAISEIAVMEYASPSAGSAGYSEAWMQAAACSNIFRQYDLFTVYQ